MFLFIHLHNMFVNVLSAIIQEMYLLKCNVTKYFCKVIAIYLITFKLTCYGNGNFIQGFKQVHVVVI